MIKPRLFQHIIVPIRSRGGTIWFTVRDTNLGLGYEIRNISHPNGKPFASDADHALCDGMRLVGAIEME